MTPVSSSARAHARAKGLVVAALAVTVAVAPDAAADRTRYTRDPVKIVAPPVKGPVRSAPAAEVPPRPIARPDDILAARGKVQPIRREQIRILDGLIDDCDAAGCEVDELAGLHFQKAELYALEQQWFKLETQRLAIAADTANTAADKTRLARESEAVAAKAKKSLLNAVVVYKALADDARFKNYGNMSRALYYYGFMLGAGGYHKEQREVFDKLLREYPQTDYAAEAHFAFADYHFENNQLADAEARYKRVLQFPKSPAFWFAKYKLGWVKLNLGKHEEALEIFHDVATGTKGDPDHAVLHRAAKNDIVRAYAEVGNVRRARDYFKKLDGKAGMTMYELLADILRDQGKSEKAIYVYRDLIGVAPSSKNVCLWQHHIADAMLTAGSNADKLDELGRLVALYTTVAAKRTLPAEELAECHDFARDMTSDLARTWHQEWAKTHDVNSYQLSAKAYALYLGAFRDDAQFAETQYYRAELAWSRADLEKNQRLASQLWDDAAAAFIDVVETNKVDRARIEESARAAVLATVNGRDGDPRPVTPTLDAKPVDPDAIPKPKPIPERDRKVLAAFDLYLASVKDKTRPERIEMTLHKANLLRRHDHLAEALPLLREVAGQRKLPVAEDAANFVLDSYNRLGRYDDLVGFARELLADTAFLADRPEMKQRLVAIDITYQRKKAERLEAEGRRTGDLAKLVACGKAYTELYNRDTEAKGADELLYDAAVCFEDGKSVGLALEMYKKLEDMGDTAREDLRAHAVGRLGAAYARIAQYELASKYLELFYAKYAGVKGEKDLKDAKDALSDAVTYRKGIGDDALAIKDTLAYVANRDARPGDKAEAFFNLYAIYDKQGDTDALVAHLRKYVGQYGATGGVDRLVQAYARIGLALWTASCPGKTVDGACMKVERQRGVEPRGSKRKRIRINRAHCGEGSTITVLDRDRRKVDAAMTAFEDAIAALDKADKRHATVDTTTRYWYAVARFYHQEPGFEAYLELAFPANLDFSPKLEKKSMARFDRWYVAKQARAADLKQAYQAVIALGEPQNAIAAAARIGEVAQNASDTLFAAEIPAALRPYEEAADRYCDALESKTSGLIELTVDAYSVCLDTSTKLGWFSEWSRLCERELGQLQAGTFPSTTERRPAPDRTSVITDVEPRAVIAGP